jgi:predicted ATPase
MSHARQGTPPWGDELPLVGRRGIREQLRLSLDDALDGRGHTMLLCGESGVGKSRLLADLAREARGRGMLVASGRAYSVDSGMPYGAIADALTAPLRALEPAALTVLARGADSDLQAVLPSAFADRIAPAAPASLTGEGRLRQFWNIAQFLARLADRTGLLLLLDNAHWSDPSSLELLHFVARQAHEFRLLIVLAYHDAGLEANANLRQTTQSLAEEGRATRCTIEPLTGADLGELLQRVFGIAGTEAQPHAQALFERTRGNCFFVEHALKALLAAGRIHQQGSGWLVEDTMGWELPATAREAVRARIEALGRDARRVADVAAVLDGPASLDLLERVSGLDAEPFADAIDELCHRRLLTERREGDETSYETSYEFTHPILHETVRAELSAARERTLHASVASALEHLHGSRATLHASQIARHLVRGRAHGGDDRALQYLLTAARDALALRADEEAARWLGEALAIAQQ